MNEEDPKDLLHDVKLTLLMGLERNPDNVVPEYYEALELLEDIEVER